nr:MAG TPA: hypothetical protein [Caudoviricetes sp.]
MPAPIFILLFMVTCFTSSKLFKLLLNSVRQLIY